MLDHAAVHIDDVERSVGTELHVYRAEPLVGRGEEFFAFVSGLGSEGRAGGLHDLAVNQVAGWVASEDVPLEFGGQEIAPIDIDAAGSSELAGVQIRRRPRP